MPDQRNERPRFCSRCGQAVTVVDAIYCKHCGERLETSALHGIAIHQQPLIFFLLSIVPGLGHWYKGRRARGLLWFAVVSFFYMVFPPGFGVMMHLICAGNAALGGLKGDALVNRRGLNRAS